MQAAVDANDHECIVHTCMYAYVHFESSYNVRFDNADTSMYYIHA